MNTEVIVMYNNLAMFILSFSTTYWLYRSYAFPELIDKLNSLDWTFVHGYDYGVPTMWHKAVIVQYKPLNVVCQHSTDMRTTNCNDSLKTIYLFSEHENLFEQCNDLLSGDRQLIGHNDFYSRKCNNFIFYPLQRFRTNSIGVTIMENVCFYVSCMCVALMVVAIVVGTYAAFKESMAPQIITATTFGVLAVSYLIVITLYGIKFRLLQKETHAIATAPNVDAQERLVHEYMVHSVGYSMGAACCSCFLTLLSAYIFLNKGRAYRQATVDRNRRRQMHVALLHQCRPDVALAVRKKVYMAHP